MKDDYDANREIAAEYKRLRDLAKFDLVRRELRRRTQEHLLLTQKDEHILVRETTR